MEVVALMCLICTCINSVNGKLFTIEVENFVSKAKRMTRSNASGNFSAHLLVNDVVKIDFCVQQTTVVSVDEVVYSNDGPPDTLSVRLGDQLARKFTTPGYEGGGQGWNRFNTSGRLSGNLELKPGKHSLTVDVLDSDSYGLELDKVVLNVGDDDLDNIDFSCNVYCFDNINYDDVRQTDSIPSGRFVQMSKPTSCAEQDNIRVDIYHNTATKFRLSSRLPRYVSFSNYREPVYTGCVLASPFWNFTNVSVNHLHTSIHSPFASLSFGGSNTYVIATIIFNFMQFTRTRELDERLIGSVLRLRLRNMHKENVSVKVEYRQGGKWVPLEERLFTPFNNDQEWLIADRTWDVYSNNQIKLHISTGNHQEVVIDSLQLDRRVTQDETVDLYADSNIVFQGVRLGFWHHWKEQPDSMTVDVGGTVSMKIDSIRVYVKVPWASGYAQVFVLFQDGRVRLQAMTPHGLDYVPFGSSVYIGQPRIISRDDPYVPIRKLTISPTDARMTIEYTHGESAVFHLTTTFTETALTVTDTTFSLSRAHFPVLIFKSMWISDGFADVDHVSLNGEPSRHVYSSDWTELFGTSAVFFRKCISRHNTQAPDVTIQFL